MNKTDISAGELLNRLSSIVVFSQIASAPVLSRLVGCLDSAGLSESEKCRSYAEFVGAVYENGCDLGVYLKNALLQDENEYILLLSQKKEVPACLYSCVQAELELFSVLSGLGSRFFSGLLGLKGAPEFDSTEFDFRALYEKRLERLFCDGYGVYSRFVMFAVDSHGGLLPLKNADKISVDELIGYEAQRGQVINNTLALISGKPAANLLLSGDAGTGKSSTVKAVANLFADRGVRLIELQKQQLCLLPQIMDKIAQNPLKFIIFIDDLSFRREESTFGTLKAILEGTAAAKTQNAVIYATSNRRHLINESFSDRDGDDVHRNDTIEELTSLSARFGLNIQYSKPNKQLYLQIVRSLAQKSGIDLPDEELCRRAEAFALRKGGRSARGAKQFVQLLLAGTI